jgi:hypothetical protein
MERQVKFAEQVYAVSLRQLAELRKLLPGRNTDVLKPAFPVFTAAGD